MDIEKLAEEIFEQEDDLPQTLTTRCRIWLGVIEIGDVNYRPVVGYSEEDLRRKAKGWATRLVWYDYYDGGLQAILEDSVEQLWDHAYKRAEKMQKVKESEE